MKNSKKGQAAMEYLMTYGWAIMVIVIVLAVLVFYLPRLIKTPEMCMFESTGFSCSEPPAVIVADSNDNIRALYVLTNEQGRAVSISGVLCTTAPSGDISKDMAESLGPIQLAAGSTQNFSVECVDEAGNPLVMSPNSEFRGTIAVIYNHVPEVPGAPSRMAKAGLTGTVVSE